ELFRVRGVNLHAQPVVFTRVPQERRRYLSVAGGMPITMLEEAKHSSRRVQKIRRFGALKGVTRAGRIDRPALGLIPILPYEGRLAHPWSGPREQLYWRRAVVQSTEPPRSRVPVVEPGVVASIGAVFDIRPRRAKAEPAAVEQVLGAIGLGPNGRPWDCRACG